jgi:hypothetical protein
MNEDDVRIVRRKITSTLRENEISGKQNERA